MKHKYALALLAFITLIGLTSSVGSVANGQAKQERLSPVVEWVLAEGKPFSYRVSFAQLMGLGHSEVQYMQKGFQKEDMSKHFCQVVKDREPAIVMIVLFFDTGDSIFWRATKAGDLVRTIRVESDRVSMRVVPNADYAGRFAEELKYWETKVAEKTKPAEKSN